MKLHVAANYKCVFTDQRTFPKAIILNGSC